LGTGLGVGTGFGTDPKRGLEVGLGAGFGTDPKRGLGVGLGTGVGLVIDPKRGLETGLGVGLGTDSKMVGTTGVNDVTLETGLMATTFCEVIDPGATMVVAGGFKIINDPLGPTLCLL